MNESFIHHVLRVALILGVIAGLAGFAVLLYAADFWSSPASQNRDEPPAVAATQAPALEASRNFGERTVIWMFGEPDAVPPATPAEVSADSPVVGTGAEPVPAPQFEIKP